MSKRKGGDPKAYFGYVGRPTLVECNDGSLCPLEAMGDRIDCFNGEFN
jgi:hypothetical protein